MGTEILLAIMLFGGGWYVGHENITVVCKAPPLVIQNCPELTPLETDDFGATTLKLVDTAKIYYQCRASCITGE